jgi:hypothetical protein
MAQFFGDMKEKCSQRVEIKDMDPLVFKSLLHFIYTDTMEEFNEKDEAATVFFFRNGGIPGYCIVMMHTAFY